LLKPGLEIPASQMMGRVSKDSTSASKILFLQFQGKSSMKRNSADLVPASQRKRKGEGREVDVALSTWTWIERLTTRTQRTKDGSPMSE